MEVYVMLILYGIVYALIASMCLYLSYLTFHFPLFWTFLFALSASTVMILNLKNIIRFVPAKQKLRRQISNEVKPEIIFGWLSQNRLHDGDTVVKYQEERISVYAHSLLITVLFFNLIPWSPSSTAGHLIRIIVYLPISYLLGNVIQVIIEIFLGMKQKAIIETVNSSNHKSCRIIRMCWLAQKILVCDMSESDDAKNKLVQMGEGVAEFLIPKLYDKEGRVRQSFSDVLYELGNKSVDPLIAALDDQNYRIRQKAAHLLGKIGDSGAIDPLTGALGDKSKTVRKSAAEALVRMDTFDAFDTLIKLLDNESDLKKNGCVIALGELGDERAVEHLIPFLDTEDDKLKKSVVVALKRINTPEAIEAIGRIEVEEIVEEELVEQIDTAESYSEEDYVSFLDKSTTDPSEAMDILFNRALKILPTLPKQTFTEQYNQFRESWGDLPLVEESAETIKKIIMKNAKQISARHDFDSFIIKIYGPYDGYKDREAAAFQAMLTSVGWIVMFWKTEEGIHAFGRSELLTQ